MPLILDFFPVPFVIIIVFAILVIFVPIFLETGLGTKIFKKDEIRITRIVNNVIADLIEKEVIAEKAFIDPVDQGRVPYVGWDDKYVPVTPLEKEILVAGFGKHKYVFASYSFKDNISRHYENIASIIDKMDKGVLDAKTPITDRVQNSTNETAIRLLPRLGLRMEDMERGRSYSRFSSTSLNWN